MKSGNLNILEPSWPLQACNGTALPCGMTMPPLKRLFAGFSPTTTFGLKHYSVCYCSMFSQLSFHQSSISIYHPGPLCYTHLPPQHQKIHFHSQPQEKKYNLACVQTPILGYIRVMDVMLPTLLNTSHWWLRNSAILPPGPIGQQMRGSKNRSGGCHKGKNSSHCWKLNTCHRVSSKSHYWIILAHNYCPLTQSHINCKLGYVVIERRSDNSWYYNLYVTHMKLYSEGTLVL